MENEHVLTRTVYSKHFYKSCTSYLLIETISKWKIGESGSWSLLNSTVYLKLNQGIRRIYFFKLWDI